MILFVPASGRSCTHCWDDYYIQGIDHVFVEVWLPCPFQNYVYWAWRRNCCWKINQAGVTGGKGYTGGQAETTDTLYAHEDPDLFGEVIQVASLFGFYFEISPWHLRGRLRGSCFGIVPSDTSPLTHSMIPGNVGEQRVRGIPSRQVSGKLHTTDI